MVERARTAWRRMRGRKPRLVWGPMPIISIKYWSAAMRARGYESHTAVLTYYEAISQRGDFDLHREDFLGPSGREELLRDYAFYAWALRNGDVFLRFFDMGFLKQTPWRWREDWLIRLAGKKLIASPYGSDIAVAGELGDLEGPLFEDYPALREVSANTRRQVLHTALGADLVIRNHQAGFMPRYDVIWPTQIAIDTDRWNDPGAGREADGGEVVIVHAPNHRHIKGTEHILAAVERLRQEGLPIRLELLERRQNEEVRQAILACDIVADQLLLPGHALFSIEAMAAGKPVLANTGALPADLRETEAMRECPVMDSNPSNVEENLRRLVGDPDLRTKLGREGREFVIRHHSYDATADQWEAILEHVWAGEPLPRHLVPAGRRAAQLEAHAR